MSEGAPGEFEGAHGVGVVLVQEVAEDELGEGFAHPVSSITFAEEGAEDCVDGETGHVVSEFAAEDEVVGAVVSALFFCSEVSDDVVFEGVGDCEFSVGDAV